MNTIVRKYVLAARLPEEFRPGLNVDDQVTVTAELERSTADVPPTLEQLMALIDAVQNGAPIDDDPVSRIRILRDKWDD